MFVIFSTPEELAEAVASDIADKIKEAGTVRNSFSIALSGGNTPKLLFRILAEKYASTIDWSLVHLFWGDERCVPPDDEESNYGMTYKILLSRIRIPGSNIHRIRGEDDPVNEAERYSDDIVKYSRSENGLPVMDIIILGMGEDGHTASIFPGNTALFHSEKLCEVSMHPVSGQKRVTVTGKVINNADSIIFMVTGSTKAGILKAILRKEAFAVNYPAAMVSPVHGKVKWFLDKEAGRML